MAFDRTCAREILLALRAAEVVTLEQLARQDDLRALAGGLANHVGHASDVRRGVIGKRGLERGDGYLHAQNLPLMVTMYTLSPPLQPALASLRCRAVTRS